MAKLHEILVKSPRKYSFWQAIWSQGETEELGLLNSNQPGCLLYLLFPLRLRGSA